MFAGLTHPHCAGVLALTNDDNANLAIAIAARLLAPRLAALCRAESRETAANMASFGTRHIINRFEKFSEYLALALHAPASWHLLIWLTGLPGTTIERHRDPPRGAWVLCGHGRFGRFLVEAMEREDVPVTIIDREPRDAVGHPWIQGDGTGAEALTEAGIAEAAGIIASTGSDVGNLSIAVTARELNPGVFVILRQNLHRGEEDHVLLPGPGTTLRAGDELLLVDRRAARAELGLVLSNEYALHYVLTGEELPRGWLWQRFGGSDRTAGSAR